MLLLKMHSLRTPRTAAHNDGTQRPTVAHPVAPGGGHWDVGTTRISA